MCRTWRAAAMIMGALAAFAPTTALAELPRPFSETEGVIIEGHFAVNGVTDDDYVDDYYILGDFDVDPIVGIGIYGAYRPLEFLSAGLYLHYGFLNADGRGLDNEYSGYFSLSAEVRGHLPMERFDPWVGFGIGYLMTHGRAEDFLGDEDAVGKLSFHGAGFALSTGLNIFITRRFALGVFFRMVLGAWGTGCYDLDYHNRGFTVHEDECDNLEDFYGVDDRDDIPDMPHFWNIGIDASYIFAI